MSVSHLHPQPTIIRADGNYFGAVERRGVMHGLHLSETRYVSGAQIPSHEHECPSFFMPLEGTFVEGCGSAVRQYEAGDVGYHPSHESHWLDAHGPSHTRVFEQASVQAHVQMRVREGTLARAHAGLKTGAHARGFAVEIGAEWRNSFGGETRWDRVPRDLSRTDVPWLLGKLYRELYLNDSARPLEIEALALEIGLRLADAARVPEKRAPRWLNGVRDLLNDAGPTAPSLSMLAAQANVTPAAVIRAFRMHEGCTPGTYLRQLRLAAARRAIANSDRPLSVIALEAGFYDQSHFTRAFTAAAGMSPSVYRHTLRR